MSCLRVSLHKKKPAWEEWSLEKSQSQWWAFHSTCRDHSDAHNSRAVCLRPSCRCLCFVLSLCSLSWPLFTWQIPGDVAGGVACDISAAVSFMQLHRCRQDTSNHAHCCHHCVCVCVWGRVQWDLVPDATLSHNTELRGILHLSLWIWSAQRKLVHCRVCRSCWERRTLFASCLFGFHFAARCFLQKHVSFRYMKLGSGFKNVTLYLLYLIFNRRGRCQ